MKLRLTSHRPAAAPDRHNRRRLCFETLEDRRVLAAFTVTNLGDGEVLAPGDLPGTLRQAVFDANQVGGLDDIVFAAGLSGTILLTEGELAITDSVNIFGPGAGVVTIEAIDPTPDDINGDGSRIFNVDDSSGVNLLAVTISGLTLTGGDVDGGGGAILSAENLTIQESLITGNSATNNFLAVGGGIYQNAGTLIVTSSTISNNVVLSDGLGVAGGGLAVIEANLSLTNSTVSSNRAQGFDGADAGGGGIALGEGVHSLSHATVADNTANGAETLGGGIFVGEDATVQLDHTIVADNFRSGLSGDGQQIFSTTPVDTRYSLVEHSTGWTVNDQGNNIFGLDPALGNLRDNGGPTPTHALRTGSPAIDAGSSLSVLGATDQRGIPFARRVDGNGSGTAERDLGAYERQSVVGLNLVVDTAVDENDGSYDPGDLSLREAIALANGSVGTNTITFHSSLGGATILLTKGQLAIHDSMTIDATTVGSITIDASGSDPTPDDNLGDGSRIFEITNDDFPTQINVQLTGLTLTGGDVNGNGGAILSEENLTLSNLTLRDNHAVRDGGGLWQRNGALLVERSTISGNLASTNTLLSSGMAVGSGGLGAYGGGGVKVYYAASAEFVHVTISGNRVHGNQEGGGLIIGRTSATIRHSTIANNSVQAETPPGSGSGDPGSPQTFGGNIYVHNNPNDHPFLLDHTIVAGGEAEAGSDIFSHDAEPITATNSLIEDASGLAIVGLGNITGFDPLLGPLADNGGPTKTHALLPGSLAIDGGSASFLPPPTTDQRGAPFARLFDGDGVGAAIIDIGAYERQTVAGLNLSVDTLVDEIDGVYTAGDLSLREAVGLANGSIGMDTITFAPDLVGGTIRLRQGEMQITDEVHINAVDLNGALTIDAGGQDLLMHQQLTGGSRIFNVDDGNAALIGVTLTGLTLTGGLVAGDGGAILTAENLTINVSTIHENSALGSTVAGSGSGGTPLISGRGGGVHVHSGGVLNLAESTVDANFAHRGGGISTDDGAITAHSSTISSNQALGQGGGIWITGTDSTLAANHSTIAANQASTSIIQGTGHGSGILTGDGGGIWAGTITAINLNHTIVGDNNAFLAPDIASTTDVNLFYSLVEGGTGFTAIGGPQIVGQDPLLVPLNDNGGPTKTHALRAGSPAIDAGQLGITMPPAFDQRGGPFMRVVDGNDDFIPRIDIGSYERQTLTGLSLVVDTTSDLTDGDFSSGNLSLREAVKLANGSVGEDTITFAPGLAGATILLVQGELSVVESVQIDAGNLPSNVIVDASGSDPTPNESLGDGSRVLTVSDQHPFILLNVDITGLTLTGGDVRGDGGAIFSEENLTITQSTITNSSASGQVNGLFSFGGSGGGISQRRGQLAIHSSTVSANSALGTAFSGRGGGIYVFDPSSFTLLNSTVSGNLSTGMGGGIYLDSTDADLRHTTVAANEALGSGGGVADPGGGLTLNHTIVADNVAPTAPDINGLSVPMFYSLVENGNGFTPTNSPRIVGTDPMLGPLADNGGRTQTHALLPGSAAIDAGELGIVDPPAFDQRGNGFARIVDGNDDTFDVIDMGAYELNPGGPALPGDYNQDGRVNAADYVLWRNTEDDVVPPFSGADGNGNGMIDAGDYHVWRDNFGNTLLPASGSGANNVNTSTLDDQTNEATGDTVESKDLVFITEERSAEHPTSHPTTQVTRREETFDASLLLLAVQKASHKYAREQESLIRTNHDGRNSTTGEPPMDIPLEAALANWV